MTDKKPMVSTICKCGYDKWCSYCDKQGLCTAFKSCKYQVFCEVVPASPAAKLTDDAKNLLDMAIPATPILRGNDAINFLNRMAENSKSSSPAAEMVRCPRWQECKGNRNWAQRSCPHINEHEYRAKHNGLGGSCLSSRETHTLEDSKWAFNCPACVRVEAPAQGKEVEGKDTAFTLMKRLLCPKCGERFDTDEAEINHHSDPIEGYLEVEISCFRGHRYFTRIIRCDLTEV